MNDQEPKKCRRKDPGDHLECFYPNCDCIRERHKLYIVPKDASDNGGRT